MVVYPFSLFEWPYCLLDGISEAPVLLQLLFADTGYLDRDTLAVIEYLPVGQPRRGLKPEPVGQLNHHTIFREYIPVDSPKYDQVVVGRITTTLKLPAALGSQIRAYSRGYRAC